ncbi:DsbA family protein [Mucilaginibacter sp. AK015]|uniref:DsbA family protein n=1 Tax=Mucilaginibacter sp. AK015 TaxID=2723072 RepID=UPI00161B0320|nr:DsbA family protein [Mucilaginibacter sp. AK015]MBB5397347.1 protein-disulfide isomerase [Mucilaginibacter sp. AK015]
MKLSKLSETGLSQLIGTIQLVLIIFLIGYVLNLNTQLSRINKKLAGITTAGKKTPDRVVINPDKQSPVLGPDDAAVTMTIFSDFECSFCKVFATEIFPELKSKYVDKGLIKVNFRHLPLAFHKNALMAAEASACANEQGKFWALHDYLFKNQSMLSTPLIDQWASTNKLDTARFKGCIIDHKYTSKIEKDIAEAKLAGLEGTPAIVINGQLTMGARTYEHFADLIEKELSKACADCKI